VTAGEILTNKQQIGVLFPPMVKSTFVDFNAHESIPSRLVTLATSMAPDFSLSQGAFCLYPQRSIRNVSSPPQDGWPIQARLWLEWDSSIVSGSARSG